MFFYNDVYMILVFVFVFHVIRELHCFMFCLGLQLSEVLFDDILISDVRG
jgi:hypothetical protein